MVTKYFNTFLTAFFLLTASAVQAQRVSINPTILHYNVSPGETSVQTITIINLSEQKQTFELSIGDWLRDSVGGHKYFPPGTLKNSSATWVKLDNAVVEVEAKQTKDVRVTMIAPSDQAQFQDMRWAMLYVQNATEQAGSSAAGGQVTAKVVEVFRFGIHIYQTPPKLIKHEAKALSLSPDTLKNTYNFTMANTGSTQLTCKARLELTNIANGQEIKLEEIEFPVFPGAKRTVQLTIPETVPKGKYSMLALLDYEASMPLEAVEMNIEIK